MNPRKASVAVNDVAHSGAGIFVMKSRHSSLNSYSSLPPDHHAFSGSTGGFRSHGSSHPLRAPLPPPVYASLPSSFCIDQYVPPAPPPPPPHPLVQPPLLPLPSLPKSAAPILPPSPKTSRTNAAGNGGMVRSRDHRTKPKPQKAVFNYNEEAEGVLATESIYSLSPPPSNLPLPSFLLTRSRAAGSTPAAGCNGGAIMERGGVAGDCGRG